MAEPIQLPKGTIPGSGLASAGGPGFMLFAKEMQWEIPFPIIVVIGIGSLIALIVFAVSFSTWVCGFVRDQWTRESSFFNKLVSGTGHRLIPIMLIAMALAGAVLLGAAAIGLVAHYRSQPPLHTAKADPAPEPPKQVVLEKLPASEVEKRIKILDDAYAILRDRFEPAIDEAGRVKGNWASIMDTGGPQKLRGALKEVQVKWSENAVALGKLSQQYSYYPDIQEMLNQSYQAELQESLAFVRRAAEAMPDPLAGDWKFIFQPYMDRYEQGVVKWAQWTHSTKDKIIVSRNQYLGRVAR